ncbi:hypothetical protein [Vibrio sp. HN007]|uniref:hypothetical protein n=1 Tax=Vibrio iocasae TaxID=3098914 RepID=UPI0035D4EA6D
MENKITKEIRNLECELKKGQSRVKRRTLTLVNIYAKIDELQKKLDDILYKKDQRGIQATITVYADIPGAYRGVANATFVDFVRNTRGWKLVEVRRDRAITADIQIHNLDKYKEQIAYKIVRETQRIVCPDIQD